MSNSPPRLDTIFCEAIDLHSPEARAAYVVEACAGDDGLRQQVESLVAAHFRAGSFLDRPGSPADNQAAPEAPGTMIGPYKLLEPLGEGGMGIVYVAEQTAPVRRRVALKVIKPGMDTREVIARFEAERQALALMDHPNIAKILDGGATGPETASVEPSGRRGLSEPRRPDGSTLARPYFVMELVRGLPITEYCDRANLPPCDRLTLFAQVCRAVQHAHQKGIIHRDLKPSNILVTLHDGTPVPKVIDFGVAKAVNQPLTERSVYTRFTQLIGTPLYMAPEQAELSGLDIDTRADVYALGVLLYELLTGTTPFDKETLHRAGLDEVRRIIREEEPPRPSARLSSLGAEVRSGVSGRRGLDERRLVHLLRGDLDWVAMKALEKDRNRRYESAGAFAADVERYLADEPVEACPPSAWYRLRKAARRHKAALATAGLVAAALVAGTAVSVWQAVQATEARHRAEAAEERAITDAAIAREVNAFLQVELIGQAAIAPPGREFGGDPYLTVRDAIDRATARIDRYFQDKPLVEAAIRTVIGQAYNNLDRNRLAVPQLERAVALRLTHLGPDHADTIVSMRTLAFAYMWIGRSQDAIALCQQILDRRLAALGPDHPDALEDAGELSAVYEHAGQWKMSVRLLEPLLAKRRAIHGQVHPKTAGTAYALARNYAHLDRLGESIALYELALNSFQVTTGPDDDITLWCTLMYAEVCQQAGEFDRADRLLREAIVQYPKRDGLVIRTMSAANARGLLALNLLRQKQFAAAEALAREAIATFRTYRPDNPNHFCWMSVLGEILVNQKKYAEAESLLVQACEGFGQRELTNRGDQHRQAEARERVIRFYEETGQPEKARAWREKLSLPKLAGR